MRVKHGTFIDLVRARRPLGTDEFRLLRDTVAVADEPSVLRELFQVLDHELAGAIEGEPGIEPASAAELCRTVVEANPEVSVSALAGLLRDGSVQFQDPLLAVVFETASQSPPLLAWLADVVEQESQLVQSRVRALEALVTRSPEGAVPGSMGLEAEFALRFLNSGLDELVKGPMSGLGDAYDRLVQGFSGLGRLFPDGEEPEAFAHVGEALTRLGSAPLAPETMRVILRILRANAPLPSWYPAGGRRAGIVGALIVDKSIQAVLTAAAAQWHPEPRNPTAPAGRAELELSPFNERALESALLDSARAPRTRAAAAALLWVLASASPAVRLSRRAGLYADLILAPHLRGRGAARDRGPAATVDSEDTLDLLLEAVGDTSAYVRRGVAEAARDAAERHPAWFRPKHYTKLLPLLSDDDPEIRAGAMRAFQALAGFRSRNLAAVVDGIAARLHHEDAVPGADDEEAHARRDLELALGITMDRLVDDVEQLQKEVQALEARRRELLQHMESQAVRVGEEIHHEVLNTLTSYLATAIDEENYAEAKSGLARLIAELRRIMNNLYPRDLEIEGFLQTIRNRLRDAQAQMLRRRPGCIAELDCPPEITDAVIAERVGDPGQLVLLYRIVLEAISNARKHSRGTRITVAVQAPRPGVLELSISDNGGGDAATFAESVGMTLMRRRAEEIGADIEYRRRTGGGTTVLVRVPGRRAEEANGTARSISSGTAARS